jgi:pimeloyl-ACP methyl ester carboxylesterase
MSESEARSSRRKWLLTGLAVVAVLLLLAYGAASFVVYDGVGTATGECHPTDQKSTPAAFNLPKGVDAALAAKYAMPEPQEIRFASRDPQIPDAELAAWWISQEQADAPAVVVVHGVQSCRREGSVLLAAGMLYKAGFSVFVMDLRDHGDSEGDDMRFAAGSEEYLDVLGGWDWVRSQGVPAEKVGLLGMSMGSLSSVIAGAQDKQVPAVWADSAATRMDEAIGNFLAVQIGDTSGLSKVLVPGGLLWARILAGDDLTKFSLIDQVDAYAGRNIAFVHGAADETLPSAWATELHDRAVAAGATTPDAWIVPEAGHNQGDYVDPDGYEQRLVSFFTTALGAP